MVDIYFSDLSDEDRHEVSLANKLLKRAASREGAQAARERAFAQIAQESSPEALAVYRTKLLEALERKRSEPSSTEKPAEPRFFQIGSHRKVQRLNSSQNGLPVFSCQACQSEDYEALHFEEVPCGPRVEDTLAMRARLDVVFGGLDRQGGAGRVQ